MYDVTLHHERTLTFSTVTIRPLTEARRSLLIPKCVYELRLYRYTYALEKWDNHGEFIYCFLTFFLLQ